MWNNFIKEFLDNELQKKEDKKTKEIEIQKIKEQKFHKMKEKKELKKVIQINNWTKEKKDNNETIKSNEDVKDNNVYKLDKNKQNDLYIWAVDKTDSQITEIENLTKKEIAGYLDNNTNLDQSLLKMDNNKELKDTNNQVEKEIDTNIKWVKEENNKKVVKFKKNKYNKNLNWIITEFIVWITLILVSVYHINNNLAEKKFMQSSVQLRSNTFLGVLNKMWWLFSNDTQKIYVQKRENMIKKLSLLEVKANKWCDIKDYKELHYKIEGFKSSLLNTKFIPLSRFVKNYDQYNLYLYSLQKLVKRKCSSSIKNKK